MADEYIELLEKSTRKYMELSEQRDCLLVEIEKLRQFLYATYQLLSPEDQKKFTAQWKPWMDKTAAANMSLADAIRNVLRASFPKSKTVAGIRDALQTAGFDFSTYTSNPLASISTTLRRLKEAGQAASEETEGVTGYRASGSILDELKGKAGADRKFRFRPKGIERR